MWCLAMRPSHCYTACSRQKTPTTSAIIYSIAGLLGRKGPQSDIIIIIPNVKEFQADHNISFSALL
ncbi:uncharacterized protein QC763_0041110 [Podospora pseudopauciseta]|uniref:Uncharacterized protein n=2 Tax=Podospora TaxID=5144 RepID=A0ABR0HQN9_9PEZI|nr:hypothetical protein QC763_0041110 [Podospora pseudopauciseta]KAK4680120.1 hypothetical protein QC764_0041790 [Podospora pseudoanserina]